MIDGRSCDCLKLWCFGVGGGYRVTRRKIGTIPERAGRMGTWDSRRPSGRGDWASEIQRVLGTAAVSTPPGCQRRGQYLLCRQQVGLSTSPLSAAMEQQLESRAVAAVRWGQSTPPNLTLPQRTFQAPQLQGWDGGRTYEAFSICLCYTHRKCLSLAYFSAVSGADPMPAAGLCGPTENLGPNLALPSNLFDPSSTKLRSG